MSDQITISSFISVLKASSQRVMATIALFQCRIGHCKFYDSRLNSWHDGISQALPDSLNALRVAAARFSDTSSVEQGVTGSKAPGEQAASFASIGEAATKAFVIQLAKWAGVGVGECFRCGGDHHLRDCKVTAEQVAARCIKCEPTTPAKKGEGTEAKATGTGTTALTSGKEVNEDDEEDPNGAMW